MYIIKSKSRGPISLVVKSFSKKRESPKALTTLTLFAGKEKHLADERIIIEYLERLKKERLLTYKYLPQNTIEEME